MTLFPVEIISDDFDQALALGLETFLSVRPMAGDFIDLSYAGYGIVKIKRVVLRTSSDRVPGDLTCLTRVDVVQQASAID